MEVPKLARRFAAHLRAAALAAGGSLVACAGALVMVELRGAHGGVWGQAWMGASILSVGLAARFGHREPAAGVVALAGRALSALVLGAVLVGIAAIPFASSDAGRIETAGAFAAVGAAMMIVAAFAGRRRAVVEAPIAPELTGALPAAPREEPAAAYALVASGPPVTAEESERSAVAIEVRLSWGGELLRIEHLDPPRGYFAGEIAGDLALSRGMLGADHAALVRCDAGSAPRAVVPPGAKAVVERAGDARGPRREDAAAGATIALELGVRVAMTFASGARSAYRAPVTDALVVVEIALVRAGRVVGREPARGLARAERLLAAWAVTGAVVATALAWSAREAPPLPADRDEVSSEQAAAIFELLADRRTADDDEPPPPRPVRRSWIYYTSIYDNAWMFPEGPYGPTVLDAFPEFVTRFYCPQFEASWYRGADPTVPGREYCASRVSTPFGVRGEWPAAPDLLGRDRYDLWLLRYPTRPEANHGRVHFSAPVVRGAAPPAIVGRVIRGDTASVRRCYREQLVHDPILMGKVTVRFVIGVDGAVTNAGNWGSDLRDGDVIACIVSSFRRLSFPRSPEGITVVAQAIDLTP